MEAELKAANKQVRRLQLKEKGLKKMLEELEASVQKKADTTELASVRQDLDARTAELATRADAFDALAKDADALRQALAAAQAASTSDSKSLRADFEQQVASTNADCESRVSAIKHKAKE